MTSVPFSLYRRPVEPFRAAHFSATVFGSRMGGWPTPSPRPSCLRQLVKPLEEEGAVSLADELAECKLGVTNGLLIVHAERLSGRDANHDEADLRRRHKLTLL